MSEPILTLHEVDRTLEEIARASGAGSSARRQQLLAALSTRATAPEQDFLTRLLLGELRQGALEGLMIEAVASAAELAPGEVRRAAMIAGGIGCVARAALDEGANGLARFAMAMFQPLAPMLAQPAEDIEQALQSLGNAALEWKLDGARVQVHKRGEEVRIYTRGLNEVTGAVPEIVEGAAAMRCTDLILDGEAVALQGSGAPYPFQVTMRRFGRTLDVETQRSALPLSVYFFDCLRRNGVDLLARTAVERFEALTDAVPAHLVIPRLVTADRASAQAFYDDAVGRGHEGVMVKALDSPYEPGARSAAWLKVKRAHTLDLVVLAAEWGHGRRHGWLSNLHLGARDPRTGAFVMLGKTFKGMTDAMLEWQTRELLAREVARDDWTVHVRPQLVVEITFNDLQASPRYPGGLALRFARVKGYRPDKKPDEADTIDTVRTIYAAQSPGR
jgi:DNA ligase-1